MNFKKRIAAFVLCLALVLMIGGEFALSPFYIRAKAAESYSNALDDLKIDSNFNMDHYPALPGYTTIEVIQIAESESGELFIYTYQPGNETTHYKAMYINMSLQHVSDKNISNKLYSLTWLNSDGVFDKYIVDDFKISSDEYRYYNITSIYREYDSQVDSSSESESLDGVRCKAFPVAQLWCLYYYNGVLTYEMEKVNYVEYTNWASGSIRYDEGFKFYLDRCDSWYVGFSIDNFKVDKIFEADIMYTIEEYELLTGYGTTNEPVLISRNTLPKTLSEFDTGFNDGDGLLGKKYTWNRICSVSDFIEEVEKDTNEEIPTDELVNLLKCDFVFRFLETPNTVTNYTVNTGYEYSIITDIGLLRLHFLSEGKIYNLGCVGDLVSADNIPDMEVTAGDNLKNHAEDNPLLVIIITLLFISVIINLFPSLKFLFDSLVTFLKLILSLFITFISLPLEIFRKCVKK